MTKCKQCGKCCEAIGLHPQLTKSHVRRCARDPELAPFIDGDVVCEWWKRISRDKAISVNSNMAHRPKGTNFYTCLMLDINNRCPVHGKDKPQVCAGYPNKGDLTAHPDCAHRKATT